MMITCAIIGFGKMGQIRANSILKSKRGKIKWIYDPNIKENNYVTEVWYPELNKNMKVHGTPWKFSKTPANIRRAPKLGEHNDEILFDLGYTKGEIESLKDDKVI